MRKADPKDDRWQDAPIRRGLLSLGPSKHDPDGLWDHHWVVVKDGRVYDGTTGPKGLDIDTFKKQWVYHDGIDFGF